MFYARAGFFKVKRQNYIWLVFHDKYKYIKKNINLFDYRNKKGNIK